jgi:molecular chaperone DnaK
MARTTIDFGIDLGTTNSSIAVWKETGGYEIILNNENLEYTPSVVWIDKRGAIRVGIQAKQQLFKDVENAFAQFKLQMGTDTKYCFARSGRLMKPEELSAEVLKELKRSANQRLGEDIQAAVITVPADFDAPDCAATNRAAQLAGISIKPLLQEPVAAGLAYGFQSISDRIFWLVYDFGGGTFDAAVIQVRDGVIHVVNHGGERYLGGGDIDSAIVDQILAPAIIKEFKISDFNRGNKSWQSAFAKLKSHAEQAKIWLSNVNSTLITIEDIFRDCDGFKGGSVDFEFDLERGAIEPLMEPLIERSINICKKVLIEKRLEPSNIEKVLLVGGPTLAPYLRERLASRNNGLGIPLEFGIGPLTVVAAGAAIFAGTQRIEGQIVRPPIIGEYTIEPDYKPVGSDTEPLVGGKVLGSKGEDLSNFTIEFINTEAHPQWRSGKINLSRDGTFVANLLAEKGHTNTFLIELCNPTGTKCKIAPDKISYTIGLVISSPPLTHKIGIALANNEVDWIFEKGASLPAKKRKILKTAYFTQKGRDSIKIPLVEGQNSKADRNREIGSLIIKPEEIKRDIPVGSEVEITVEMDESRLMRVKGFIPIIDEEFEFTPNLNRPEPSPKELQEEIEREKKRLIEVEKKAHEVGDSEIHQCLQKINKENIENNLDTLLTASAIDPEAAHACKKQLLNFKAAIDELEGSIELPMLLAEAKKAIKFTKDIVQEHGNDNDKQNFKILEQETYKAMEKNNKDFLQTKISELREIGFGILRQQSGFWVDWFQYLENEKGSMRDQSQVDHLLNQGRRAMENQDLQALQGVVRQLFALLPVDKQRDAQKAFGSTVI